jgi:hypothetical protein
MLFQNRQFQQHLVWLLCAWLWLFVWGAKPVSADSVHLQSQLPKVDSSQPNPAKVHRTLHAEVHEAWLFSEMGFECSSTQPKTITKVIPGTQAALNGLEPGDQLIGFQQHGGTALIDVRRGKNIYRATITSEPKPAASSVKPKAVDSSDKIGHQSTQSDNKLYLIAECSLWTTLGGLGISNSGPTPLQWCKQQMQQLDSETAKGFPNNITFIPYTSGGYSMYEHCSIEQVKKLWMAQNGGQAPQKHGDPLQDIINSYVTTYSPEERHKHKLIVAIISTQISTRDAPPPGAKAHWIASLHTDANATTQKLDPTDVSITLLQLGDDYRALQLDADAFGLPYQSIDYLPFSNLSEKGLLPVLSRVFQGKG